MTTQDVTTTDNVSETTPVPGVRGISSLTFWTVTGTLAGLMVLVMLSFCIIIICMVRRRKRKERKDYGGNMQLHDKGNTGNRRYEDTVLVLGTKNAMNEKAVRFRSNLPSRTLTKTNGSLNLDLETDEDSIPTSDQGSSTSDGGETNLGFSPESPDSIIAYKVNSESGNNTPNDPVYQISNDPRLNEVGIPQLYNTLRQHQQVPGNKRRYDLAKTSNLPHKDMIMQLNNQNTTTPQRKLRVGPPTAPKPSIATQLKSLPPTSTRYRDDTPSYSSSEDDIQPSSSSLQTGRYHSQPGQGGDQKPFNYIAFSQYLYGEKPVEQVQQGTRNISFV